MTQTAIVTVKETGLTYRIYRMPSHSSNTTYAVWTINGNPVHCTCKDRRYRPYKMCRHMKDWQAAKRAAYVEAFDPHMVAA